MMENRRILKRGGVALLVAVPLFVWMWNSGPINLRDRLFPKHLVEVYPDALYRSGQIDSRLIEGTLRDLGIEVIVDLSGEHGDRPQRTEREVAKRLGIEYDLFQLRGSGTGEIGTYVGAVETIARAREEGRRVLVHCRAGDRRTGGVIAAYQLLVRGEAVERAYREIARFSHGSVGSSRVLAFLREHLIEIAAGLSDRGVAVRGAPSAVAAELGGPGAPESSGE